MPLWLFSGLSCQVCMKTYIRCCASFSLELSLVQNWPRRKHYTWGSYSVGELILSICWFNFLWILSVNVAYLMSKHTHTHIHQPQLSGQAKITSSFHLMETKSPWWAKARLHTQWAETWGELDPPGLTAHTTEQQTTEPQVNGRVGQVNRSLKHCTGSAMAVNCGSAS